MCGGPALRMPAKMTYLGSDRKASSSVDVTVAALYACGEEARQFGIMLFHGLSSSARRVRSAACAGGDRSGGVVRDGVRVRAGPDVPDGLRPAASVRALGGDRRGGRGGRGRAGPAAAAGGRRRGGRRGDRKS